MDVRNPSSTFVWSGSASDLDGRPFSNPTARQPLRALSVMTGLDFDACSLPLRPLIEFGRGDLPGYKKLPQYVPRRIEQNQPLASSSQTSLVSMDGQAPASLELNKQALMLQEDI
jgi:hypothetical protein